MKLTPHPLGSMGRALLVALVTVCLLSTASAWAQGLPYGTANGKVTDLNGAGLPGVSVTAKSPNLQGSRTTVTNVNGDFSFANLPPGDYTITYSLSGFTDVVKNVRLGASQQVVLDAQMSLAGVSASAVVVAQSETVSQSSQASTTLSTAVLDKLPVARTIIAAAILSPGVNQNGPNGAITISGSQSFDTVYTVNGVNIQDNVRGTPTNLFIEDAIQETTTTTSGVSAEYGRFTGGIINTITKQGGNSFSGSFRTTLSNNKWQSQTPIVQTYTDKVVPTYEATLGGPIWKDRIWFFGAGRYFKNDYSGQTVAPTNVSFPRSDTDKRYEGKLTITPFTNHTLTGSYTKQTVEQNNYYFTSLPLLETNGTTYPRQLPTDLLSINYNGVLTSSFFLDGQYSKKTFKFENSGSRFNELINGTALLIQDRGYGQMFGSIFCAVCPGATESRNNEEYAVKGTAFLSTPNLGSHNVVFGYSNFSSSRLSNNWQSGSSWLLYASSIRYDGTNLFPVIDSSSYLLYAPIPLVSKGSDLRTNSVFVNDTWRLGNKLSFNVGVRWDKNDAKDAAGATTAKDSAFSPRLAASYDLKGDGKLRFTASYAHYVGQIQETIAGSGATPAGSPASYYYYWQGADINASATGPWIPTSQVLAQMFAAEGVTSLNQFPTRPADTATVPGVNLLVGDGLRSPKVIEYVLGVGGTVGSNLVYRVDAVRREFRDFYTTVRNTATGTVTDALGNDFDLGFLVNSNVPKREYTGLHSSLSFRKGSLNVNANWTWSHMIGNFVGETSGSGPVTADYLNYPEYFNLAWHAPSGDLGQDQRHRVRLLASYDFKFGVLGVTPGLVQSYDTGTPYGAVGNANTRSFVTNPGYISPPATEAYYFTARDAYRTDDIWRTDLSLMLNGKIGPVEIFVAPQILNLFNNSRVLTPNTSVSVGTGATASASTGLVRFNPFTTAPIECPQGSSAATCKALGANWRKGADFGNPTAAASYQRPRVWTVTLGARF
ncbi:MAG: carboxypeptidase regulatory-like domain-containing protein [Thermoanaerobaculia bacterium]